MAQDNKQNNKANETIGGKGDEDVEPSLNLDLTNKEKDEDGKNDLSTKQGLELKHAELENKNEAEQNKLDGDVMTIKYMILRDVDKDGNLALQIKQCLVKDNVVLENIAGGNKDDLRKIIKEWENDIELPETVENFRNLTSILVDGFFNLKLNGT